ncbi:hypothetical protein EW145_g2292 [Phellinidium pouzarii]|uniref:Myb-like domain-containing protein n=1 Tax=Phellinidium pouzarii TaxID=167371 RepID=A0A4S4LBG3_9AGAM|nr:hypothetical protein EW145_g2292 [Phellinidium pouzarii]
MAQKAAVDSALQANKDHQYSLKVYTERIEAELKAVDKLIAAIESDDELDDVPETGAVSIEGSVKPVSVLLQSNLLSEDSPFYEDAQWKKQYDDFTTVSNMKLREHDALKEAIRTENQRMYTLGSQSWKQSLDDIRNLPPEHFEQNKEGIDWKRVAMKMNATIPAGVKRTPKECEIRWLGHLHPSFYHGQWTPEESDLLRKIIEENTSEDERVNWVEVAKKLGTNRTPIDCMRHGMSRRLHVWTTEADERLLDAIDLFGQNNWQLVAMNVSEDVTAHQCQKRYFDTLDPSLKICRVWTPDEDEKLLRAAAAFAGTPVSTVSDTMDHNSTLPSAKLAIPWQDVALFVPGRNNNQCREHYQDRLTKVKSKEKTGKSKAKAKSIEKSKSVEDGNSEAEPASKEAAPRKQRRKPRPAFKGKQKVSVDVDHLGEVQSDDAEKPQGKKRKIISMPRKTVEKAETSLTSPSRVERIEGNLGNAENHVSFTEEIGRRKREWPFATTAPEMRPWISYFNPVFHNLEDTMGLPESVASVADLSFLFTKSNSPDGYCIPPSVAHTLSHKNQGMPSELFSIYLFIECCSNLPGPPQEKYYSLCMRALQESTRLHLSLDSGNQADKSTAQASFWYSFLRLVLDDTIAIAVNQRLVWYIDASPVIGVLVEKNSSTGQIVVGWPESAELTNPITAHFAFSAPFDMTSAAKSLSLLHFLISLSPTLDQDCKTADENSWRVKSDVEDLHDIIPWRSDFKDPSYILHRSMSLHTRVQNWAKNIPPDAGLNDDNDRESTVSSATTTVDSFYRGVRVSLSNYRGHGQFSNELAITTHGKSYQYFSDETVSDEYFPKSR